MTREEASEFVTRMCEMWPAAYVNEGTIRLWVERVEKLDYTEAAWEALDRLFDTWDRPTYLPPWATLRAEYLRCRDKYLPKELPSPDITDEERAEIRERAQEYLGRLERSMEIERERRWDSGLAQAQLLTQEEARLVRAAGDEDWRADPSWRLVAWDDDLMGTKKRAALPTAEAELAGGGLWASVFKGRKAAATWKRDQSPR